MTNAALVLRKSDLVWDAGPCFVCGASRQTEKQRQKDERQRAAEVRKERGVRRGENGISQVCHFNEVSWLPCPLSSADSRPVSLRQGRRRCDFRRAQPAVAESLYWFEMITPDSKGGRDALLRSSQALHKMESIIVARGWIFEPIATRSFMMEQAPKTLVDTI